MSRTRTSLGLLALCLATTALPARAQEDSPTVLPELARPAETSPEDRGEPPGVPDYTLREPMVTPEDRALASRLRDWVGYGMITSASLFSIFVPVFIGAFTARAPAILGAGLVGISLLAGAFAVSIGAMVYFAVRAVNLFTGRRTLRWENFFGWSTLVLAIVGAPLVWVRFRYIWVLVGAATTAYIQGFITRSVVPPTPTPTIPVALVRF